MASARQQRGVSAKVYHTRISPTINLLKLLNNSNSWRATTDNDEHYVFAVALL